MLGWTSTRKTMFLPNQLDSHDTVKPRSVLSNIFFKNVSGEFVEEALRSGTPVALVRRFLKKGRPRFHVSRRFVSPLVVHL